MFLPTPWRWCMPDWVSSSLLSQWLERCYDARDVHLIFLTMDPKWDPLRTELRFSSLLQRCGFAQQGMQPRTRFYPSHIGR